MVYNAARVSFVALLTLLGGAQAGTIRGKVSSQAGKALANAVVVLVPQGLKDTTGADGSYSIPTGNTAILPSMPANAKPMTLQNGILEISLNRAVSVSVEIYDTKGSRLKSEELRIASAGVYRLDIGKMSSGTRVCLVKATVDGNATTFRFAQMNGSRALNSSFGSTVSTAGLARVAAVVDSLKVSAKGYTSKSIPVTSLDATIDVTLDTIIATGGYPFKNTPVSTSGCGKTALKSGTYTMSVAGLNREYILDVPTNYNPNKPSRLIFGMHCMGSSDKGVVGENYYQLKPYDTDKNIIFVAPQGYTDGMPWRGDDKDHQFFDALYKHLVGNLCVDSSRVFSVGFSFGAMFTNSLSRNHQKVLRAVVVFAAADYNIYEPTPTHERIAFMGTVGLSDETCPPKTGRDCKNLKVADNKCTVPASVPETTKGSGSHVVYDYQGCGNHPVRWITFDGGHDDYPKDRNQSATWMPAQTWSFINQF